MFLPYKDLTQHQRAVEFSPAWGLTFPQPKSQTWTFWPFLALLTRFILGISDPARVVPSTRAGLPQEELFWGPKDTDFGLARHLPCWLTVGDM